MLLSTLLAAAVAAVLAVGATRWFQRLAPTPPPPPWWHPALAAVLGGWAGLVHGPSWALLAFIPLMVVWSMAVVIDLVDRRLPDALTLPSYPAFLLLLVPALVLEGAPLLRVALAGIATTVALFAIAWISPRSFGLGDVKLGLTTGAALGWFGWRAVFLGTGAAFLLFAVVGLVLVVMKRANRRSELPFGPYMVAGALLGPLLV